MGEAMPQQAASNSQAPECLWWRQGAVVSLSAPTYTTKQHIATAAEDACTRRMEHRLETNLVHRALLRIHGAALLRLEGDWPKCSDGGSDEISERSDSTTHSREEGLKKNTNKL